MDVITVEFPQNEGISASMAGVEIYPRIVEAAAHDELTGCDKADLHPIAAITKLTEELDNRGPAIIAAAAGDAVAVSDSSDRKLRGLTLYGKTTQDGTPSLENPIPLVNVGGSSEINVQIYGKSVYGADVLTGEQRITVSLGAPLPPGEYVISAMVTSNDTDSKYCTVGFDKGNSDGSNVNITFDRNVYQSHKVKTTATVSRLFFNAALSVASGTGDTCTWSNVQIEVGETGTEYEAYKGAQVITLPVSNGLPGIPVTSGGNYTDENGQQWMSDEIDLERGVYVHRVGGGKLSEITQWDNPVSVGSYVRMVARAPSNWYKNEQGYVINRTHGLYTHGAYAEKYSEDSAHAYIGSTFVYVFVPAEIAPTVEAFTSWLAVQENAGHPPEIMVALDDECVVETPLTDAEIADYNALHTNNPVTTILNDSGAGMSVSYVADTKAYIDNKFTALEAAILSIGGNI